jgi:hypothetical protein
LNKKKQTNSYIFVLFNPNSPNTLPICHLKFTGTNNRIKPENDLDLLDDLVYREVVLEKLTAIEKLLKVVTNEQNPRLQKRQQTPKVSSADFVRQVNEVGVANIFPIQSVDEMMALENAMNADASIAEQVVSSFVFQK